MTPAHAVSAHIWRWDLDPLLLISVTAAGLLYASGLFALSPRRRATIRAQATAFFGALILAVAVLSGPVDAAAGLLFSAHMGQHLVLILGVAPLLVLARPLVVLTLGLPSGLLSLFNRLVRSRAFIAARSVLVHPGIATMLHLGAIWFWHLPGPYDAAIGNESLHVLEHLSFVATAVLFWYAIARGLRHRQSGYGWAMASLFAVGLGSSALGALLTFATSVLYSSHVATTDRFNISPITDQRLAGLVMWVPMGVVYLVAMAVLFLKWMNQLETRMSGDRAGVTPTGEAR